MSYTPTTWQTGDTITAEKMNNIEQGIASGGILVCEADQSGQLNKTWNAITESAFAVLKKSEQTGYYILPLCAFGNDDGEYYVEFIVSEFGDYMFSCNSSDGYPQYKAI